MKKRNLLSVPALFAMLFAFGCAKQEESVEPVSNTSVIEQSDSKSEQKSEDKQSEIKSEDVSSEVVVSEDVSSEEITPSEEPSSEENSSIEEQSSEEEESSPEEVSSEEESSPEEVSSEEESSPEEDSSIEDNSSEEPSSSVQIDPVKLDSPTISFDGDKLIFSEVEHADKYLVKVNDGQYQEASFYRFAQSEGNYTVSVKASSNSENYLESDVVTYSYQAIQSAVNKISADTLSWQSRDCNVYVDNNLITGNEYKAIETKAVTVEARGGFDEDGKIYYIAQQSFEVNLIADAASYYVIEDATDKTSSDLTDEWEIHKYDSTWVETPASIAVAKGRNDDKCAQLNCWNNYSTFRYGKQYEVTDGYNAISFDVKGDGIITLRVQLLSSKSGVYATYDFGTISTNWNHAVIALDDSSWRINFNNTSYTFNEVKSYVNMQDTKEIVSFFDTFNIILYGVTENGASSKVYFDNIRFENIDNVTTNIDNPYLDGLKNNYVASGTNVAFSLSLDENNEGTLETLNLVRLGEPNELVYPIKYSRNGSELIVKDKETDGQTFSFTGNYKNDGASIAVSEAIGSIKNYLNGAVFGTAGNLLLDFEDGDGSSTYSNAKWTQAKYDTDRWVAMTTAMNSRVKDESKVVALASGWNMSYRYTYNEGGSPLGLVDYLSIDMGNYYSVNEDMPVKIIIIDTQNVSHYLLGASGGEADKHYKVEHGTDLNKYEFSFDAIEAKSIQVVTRATFQGDTFCYIDNLEIKFRGYVIPKLDAPTNLQFAEVGNEYKITFDPVEHAEQYYGYIKDSSGEVVDFFGPRIVTRSIFIDTSLFENGLYTFFVYATAEAYDNSQVASIQFRAGNLVIDYADVFLDFSSLTTQTDFTDTEWKQYYNGTETSGQMRVRTTPVSSERVVNMYADTSVRKYTYAPSSGIIGITNYISFKIGNYYNNPKPLEYRVFITDLDGNNYYIIGDANSYGTLAVSTDIDKLEFNLPDAFTAVSFSFEFKQKASGNGYAYFNDLEISYK